MCKHVRIEQMYDLVQVKTRTLRELHSRISAWNNKMQDPTAVSLLHSLHKDTLTKDPAKLWCNSESALKWEGVKPAIRSPQFPGFGTLPFWVLSGK